MRGDFDEDEFEDFEIVAGVDYGNTLVDPCLEIAIMPPPMQNRRMEKKRGYSDQFPTTREKRVYFMLDKIPPALWIRVKAKAKRDGVSLRSLILGWCKEWVEK